MTVSSSMEPEPSISNGCDVLPPLLLLLLLRMGMRSLSSSQLVVVAAADLPKGLPWNHQDNVGPHTRRLCMMSDRTIFFRDS